MPQQAQQVQCTAPVPGASSSSATSTRYPTFLPANGQLFTSLQTSTAHSPLPQSQYTCQQWHPSTIVQGCGTQPDTTHSSSWPSVAPDGYAALQPPLHAGQSQHEYWLTCSQPSSTLTPSASMTGTCWLPPSHSPSVASFALANSRHHHRIGLTRGSMHRPPTSTGAGSTSRSISASQRRTNAHMASGYTSHEWVAHCAPLLP